MNNRFERAAELEQSVPAAAEILHFYRRILEFQETRSTDPLKNIEALLRLTARHGPAMLAQSAEAILRDRGQWESLLPEDQPDPARAFFNAVLSQQAAPPAAASTVQFTCICPACRRPPLLAILRPEGDGGKRSLLCGRCSTEWEFRRLLCPHCGEENQSKLAVYTTEAFPHVRVEACDSCRRYLKTIDLTRNGLAVPEVDELASLALDLWAVDQGYIKIQPNLFGL